MKKIFPDKCCKVQTKQITRLKLQHCNPKANMMNTTTLIIRSAGERTLELCKKLILEQGVPGEQVFVVQEVFPLSNCYLNQYTEP